MFAGLRQRNRNQARERLNRFRRSSGVVSWTWPPRQQPPSVPPRGVVHVNRVRRWPGCVIATSPRREAIPYPERIPPSSAIAIFRVPPPGRARVAWFFTKPGREGQGLPVVGKRLRLRMAAATRLVQSIACDTRVAMSMSAARHVPLTMQHTSIVSLAMCYQPRIDMWLQDP